MSEDKWETVAKRIFERRRMHLACPELHVGSWLVAKRKSICICRFYFDLLTRCYENTDSAFDKCDRRLRECILPGPNNACGLACLSFSARGQVYRGFGKQQR